MDKIISAVIGSSIASIISFAIWYISMKAFPYALNDKIFIETSLGQIILIIIPVTFFGWFFFQLSDWLGVKTVNSLRKK